MNKNLPKETQYLVTKGVPCEVRLKDFFKYQEDNAANLERDVEDGWVETSNPEKNNKDNEQPIMDLDDDEEQPMQVIGENKAAGTGGGGEDEIPDLDDLDDDNMFSQPVQMEEESKGGMDGNNVQIIKARKYDLSITYD